MGTDSIPSPVPPAPLAQPQGSTAGAAALCRRRPKSLPCGCPDPAALSASRRSCCCLASLTPGDGSQHLPAACTAHGTWPRGDITAPSYPIKDVFEGISSLSLTEGIKPSGSWQQRGFTSRGCASGRSRYVAKEQKKRNKTQNNHQPTSRGLRSASSAAGGPSRSLFHTILLFWIRPQAPPELFQFMGL